jgi:hypothetical protein
MEPTTTTADIEPPAVVSTLPPSAPPPAATNATHTTCPGDPGELNAQGVPSHLPTRFQLGGVAYLFVGAEADAGGTLTRLGCVGPFELASTDQDDEQVIYLRSSADGQIFRFEAAPTYQIQLQVTERPQVITTGDETYRLLEVWQPSVHSSTTVILFVEDPANATPEVIYAVNVSQTVVGDAIGEYRLSGQTAEPSQPITGDAERSGLHPDLTIGGLVYDLVDLYTPTGTTRNGFMTLFGTTTDGTQQRVFGRDVRHLELFVFDADTASESSR